MDLETLHFLKSNVKLYSVAIFLDEASLGPKVGRLFTVAPGTNVQFSRTIRVSIK